MKRLVFLLLVPALNACAPTLQEASLFVSTPYLQVRQGQSSSFNVTFTRYMFNGDNSEAYFLSAVNDNSRGLRVNAWKTILRANDSTTLTVSAAQNADLGKHSVEVMVRNAAGHTVQQHLTVEVVK